MNNPVNMVDENGNVAISGTVAVGALVLVVGFLAILSTTQETCKQAINDFGNAITSVGNYIDEQRRKTEKTHTVYKLRDKDTREIVYVGRTVNPKARENAHKKNKPNTEFEVIASGLEKEQARGLEQIYMVHYNTRAFLNRINGISPNNDNIKIYMEAGRQVIHLLGNVVSNEALYWTGR